MKLDSKFLDNFPEIICESIVVKTQVAKLIDSKTFNFDIFHSCI